MDQLSDGVQHESKNPGQIRDGIDPFDVRNCAVALGCAARLDGNMVLPRPRIRDIIAYYTHSR